MFRWMDAANVDLKAFSEGFYRRMATGSLAPVLDTLRWIRRETRVWLEITTLLIPGENDGDRGIEALSRWVAEELGTDVPLHFTAFHPAWRLTDRKPTPPSTLSRARLVARRDGKVTSWNLRPGGQCPCCGAPCPGVWEDRPGTWGGRRIPVRLGTAAARA